MHLQFVTHLDRAPDNRHNSACNIRRRISSFYSPGPTRICWKSIGPRGESAPECGKAQDLLWHSAKMEPSLIHPPLLLALPFCLLLAAIAFAPLFFPGWWARHYEKVSFLLAVAVIGYYLLGLGAGLRVWHTATEYFSFISLIGSLFVISGGIHINVKGEATPTVNVLFLLIGALAANVLGTTGASMLLIRPWLRMNKYRLTAHRSEEHTSELQSHHDLVCRLLLEKKN